MADNRTNEKKVKRFESCADEIQQLRDESRWIPVSERLPDEDTECLVWVTYNGSGHVDQSAYCNYGFDVAQPWLEVTHWMPLPEPPQEQGQ
jgi:hypothetical protein